ncbi:MAG: beta-hexosaminidase, partial [Paracoccaceae bacterium]
MGQGAYIFGCEGPRLTKLEKVFFASARPWGFVLFARNVETPDQLRRLTSDLRDSVGYAAPILIDQEGGRVERMRVPH